MPRHEVVHAAVGDREVAEDAVALARADQRGRGARDPERRRERDEQVEDRVLAIGRRAVALAHDGDRLERRGARGLEQVVGLRRQRRRAAAPHAPELDRAGPEHAATATAPMACVRRSSVRPRARLCALLDAPGRSRARSRDHAARRRSSGRCAQRGADHAPATPRAGRPRRGRRSAAAPARAAARRAPAAWRQSCAPWSSSTSPPIAQPLEPS